MKPRLPRRETARMHSGEQTLLVTRPTRLLSLRYYALFVLLVVGAGAFVLNFVPYTRGVVVPFLGSSLNLFLAAVLGFFALISLLIAELRRVRTRYVITDNRIIREDGILSKRTAMVPYTQLERVDLSQSLLQRALRVGTVVVDTGDDSMAIEMVPQPGKVQELLSQRMGRRAYGSR